MLSVKWHFVVCGINHTRAPIEVREPLQIGREELARAQTIFSQLPAVMESCIVSTCNRIEFYFVIDRQTDPLETVGRFYGQLRNLDLTPAHHLFYVRHERKAAEHLFRVAGGLDSMVLGETEILGQLKDAYSSSCRLKIAGKVLHRLFHQAFRVGKQVRSDTEMGQGACSVASAAVDLLKPRLRDYRNPNILFVGATQMIALAASNLATQPVGRFYFANRTVEKAQALAREFGYQGYTLDDIPDVLPEVDIVISCTGAPHVVIEAELLRNIAGHRENGDLLVVDLAVPRDIETDGNLAGITVFDLDAVKQFVETSRQRRRDAIPDAENIIEQRLAEFMYWYSHVRYEQASSDIAAVFEKIRKEEFDRIIRKLPLELQSELDDASRTLVDKMLHVRSRSRQSS